MLCYNQIYFKSIIFREWIKNKQWKIIKLQNQSGFQWCFTQTWIILAPTKWTIRVISLDPAIQSNSVQQKEDWRKGSNYEESSIIATVVYLPEIKISKNQLVQSSPDHTKVLVVSGLAINLRFKKWNFNGWKRASKILISQTA